MRLGRHASLILGWCRGRPTVLKPLEGLVGVKGHELGLHGAGAALAEQDQHAGSLGKDLGVAAKGRQHVHDVPRKHVQVELRVALLDDLGDGRQRTEVGCLRLQWRGVAEDQGGGRENGPQWRVQREQQHVEGRQ